MNQFFADAERILASAAGSTISLQRVARAAVPHLSDCCMIFLVKGKEISCAASAHVTPEGGRLLRRLNRVYKITRSDPISTVANVIRTGRPRLRSDIAHEALTHHADSRVYTIHRRLAVRSVLAVPIGAPSAVLGAISLSYCESGRRYTAQDVPRARKVAKVAETLLRRDLNNARTQMRVPLVPRRTIRLRARA